jgi:hypothetical protein
LNYGRCLEWGNGVPRDLSDRLGDVYHRAQTNLMWTARISSHCFRERRKTWLCFTVKYPKFKMDQKVEISELWKWMIRVWGEFDWLESNDIDPLSWDDRGGGQVDSANGCNNFQIRIVLLGV